MKKCITLLLAFALVVGLSQCKKKVETISSVPAGVYITLDVDGGDKVIVNPHGNPSYATVTFEDGDLIYVGNAGAHCGYLTYNGTSKRFEGTIGPTSDADYLHFYLLGNNTRADGFAANISDQTAKYPVISYGRSTYLYNSNTSNYSATLQNYCAIMRFDIAGVDTDKLIAITGMNNIATVDFSKNIGPGDLVNPYTYSKEGDGDIALHAETNTERWAILLPQDEVTTATAYTAGYSTTSAFTVPAVRANGYYANGVTVPLESNGPGAWFSVNNWGKQVLFSPGNLQYNQYEAADKRWRFAPNQYDVCQTYDGPWDTWGWVDLFGWGTWGDGQNPLNVSGDFEWTTDFTGTLEGDSTWRTLAAEEWKYMIGSRGTTTPGTDSRDGTRYLKADITVGENTHFGLIVFPDGFDNSAYPYTNWNVEHLSPRETVSAGDWASMEAAGAVFLPAAGSWLWNVVSSFGWGGDYWSSSADRSSYAYDLSFNASVTYCNGGSSRNSGQCVRLVRNN